MTRSRTLLAAALVVCLGVIGTIANATTRDRDRDDTGLNVGAALPFEAVVTPQLVIETTTTLPPLPIPEALPVDPHGPTPDIKVGTIEIPKLELLDDLQRGITLTSVDRGPGWWPGTAMPGEMGNMVVAGHRTTNSRPFNGLDTLVAGDQVIFTTDAGRFVYAVREVIVVPADWIDIAAQDYAHTATLFACHPKGSATHRVVAKLRLLNPDGTPADPDSALPPIDAEEQRTDHTLVVKAADDGSADSGDPLVGSEG